MFQTMTDHLIDAGFEFVYKDDFYVLVYDVRYFTYRVYRADNDPSVLNWIVAPKRVFETVVEAVEAVKRKEMMMPSELYQKIQQYKLKHQKQWSNEHQKKYWELLEAYEKFQQFPVEFQ